MSEIASGVFDLVNPSPATLRDLSSIATSVELWRQEIGKYRKNGTCFDKLPSIVPTFKDTIPNIPSNLLQLIEKHVITLGSSISSWKCDHSVLEIHPNEPKISNQRCILNDFDDFACDFDGSIDYVKTAKRMVTCDRLSSGRKFKIACMYCFENDIKLLWPSVSTEIVLDRINFSENPLLYYWICCMKNELFKMVSNPGISIDVHMLNSCNKFEISNWSSMVYFWNRTDFESQWRISTLMLCSFFSHVRNVAIFARYLLPKLDEVFVEKLVAERGSELINVLIYQGEAEQRCVIPVWMFIKNRIDEQNFILITWNCLNSEFESVVFECYPDTVLFSEIWKTAPNNLKRSVIQKLILADKLRWVRRDPRLNKGVTYLSRVLEYASLEERNTFWRKNWPELIIGTNSTFLNELMKLCFENNDRISEFKRNVLSKYENISSYCVALLADKNFERLEDFLAFCCLDIETKRSLMQQLLESNFLREGSLLKHYHFGGSHLLTDFINEAYNNSDQATDFKLRLFMSPETLVNLRVSISIGNFSAALELLEMSTCSEPLAAMLKDKLLNWLNLNLKERSIQSYSTDDLQKILLWCLGSEEKVTEFKKSLPRV